MFQLVTGCVHVCVRVCVHARACSVCVSACVLPERIQDNREHRIAGLNFQVRTSITLQPGYCNNRFSTSQSTCTILALSVIREINNHTNLTRELSFSGYKPRTVVS